MDDAIISPKKETATDYTRRPRPLLQTRTRYFLAFTDTHPLYTRNEKAAQIARPSHETPSALQLTTQERRMSTIIGSLLPLSTKKPPGRLIPRRHMQFPTQPPKRLVDTSKMLAAHAPNPKTRAAATRRGAYTIPACVASCQRLADRYSSPRCAIFRTLAPPSTSGMPATLVNTDTIAASAAEDAASAQSTPPSAVLAPITATAACAAVLSALTPAHCAHCNTSSFIIAP